MKFCKDCKWLTENAYPDAVAPPRNDCAHPACQQYKISYYELVLVSVGADVMNQLNTCHLYEPKKEIDG